MLIQHIIVVHNYIVVTLYILVNQVKYLGRGGQAEIGQPVIAILL